MSRGIIYMAWGGKASGQCLNSLMTLRQFERNIPVIVVGDKVAQRHLGKQRHVEVRVLDVDPFDPSGPSGHRFLAGRIKPLLYGISPWEQTLYVDADVFFQGKPERGFNLLDKGWEFVLSEHVRSCLQDAPFKKSESNDTADWLGTALHIYHNSGMLFWRRSEAVEELMSLWSEEWLRYGDWDEQIALLRALFRSSALWLTVPWTWNNNRKNKATFLYHRYGSNVARVDGRKLPHQHAKQGRKLVQVSLGNGRFVKCYAGDAAKVIERFGGK